jgi:ankyrin repeat protein
MDHLIDFIVQNNVQEFTERMTSIDVHALNDRLLRRACFYGRTNIVQLLLDRGANVHAARNDALHCAALKGYVDIVKLLLLHGANMHDNNDYVLKYACLRGRTPVVKLLLDNRIHRCKTMNANHNLLGCAATNGHVEVVELLLEYGAVPNHNFKACCV